VSLQGGGAAASPVRRTDPAVEAAVRRGRAVLSFRTGRLNEPAFRVQRGTLELVDLDIVHCSGGNDIWNGNAAVQVQPPIAQNGEPIVTPESIMPTAIVRGCDVRSNSGRGVVAIDGGTTKVKGCNIHHCAATGIYVGGPGSRAEIETTDVVYNGRGNLSTTRRGGGVGRGHSGVYLEQGHARLTDCNVSDNALTGISAVSHDNATLVLERSDLVSNAADQIEWPPLGTASRNRCRDRDNVMAAEGRWRCRSGLVIRETAPPTRPPAEDDAAGDR